MSYLLPTTFFSRLAGLAKASGEPFPLRLRGRFGIMPTRYGIVFFLMLTALLIGSINHNNNLGYLLTFLLGSMAFVSIFHTWRNLRGIEVVAARAEPVFAGEKAAFRMTLRKPEQVRPGISFSFAHGEKTTATLLDEGRLIIAVSHNTDRRGVLHISSVLVETSYPLGLFSIHSAIPVKGSCLVYPRPAPGPLVTALGRSDEESEGETGGSGVEDFSSLASYQRGDPLQHIAWKTFSRGQGLFTKKFEGQQGRTIYFDPDVLAGRDMELKLSRICFMILKADAQRLAYGLKLGARTIPPGFGGSHKRRCLSELALFGHEA